MTVDHSSATTALGIDEALARLRRYDPVPDLERLPAAQALGRILAEDVVAPLAVPAHDSSAMDGYAFRFADLAAGTILPVRGRVAAGHPLDRPLAPGTAVRIFTGGAMPEGADTVAMQERCVAGDGYVTLPMDLVAGANRRRAGEDVPAGSTVLRSGVRMRPQDIGLATSVGRETVLVRQRLKVGVVATGDELCPPGGPLPSGCIYDTNRYTVAAALESIGARATTYPSVADTRDAVRTALLAAAAGNDLVISTGGVSCGEEDHVKAVVEDVGNLDFWKLPLKPGRPIAVGEVAGTPFVGLPGNPVSAMVTFWVIARPFVLHLAGAADTDATRFPVIAVFQHLRRPGRRELLRARVRPGPDGRLRAEAYHSTSSGMLSSLTWSDGLLEIPEDSGDISPGDVVAFIPYHGLD